MRQTGEADDRTTLAFEPDLGRELGAKLSKSRRSKWSGSRSNLAHSYTWWTQDYPRQSIWDSAMCTGQTNDRRSRSSAVQTCVERTIDTPWRWIHDQPKIWVHFLSKSDRPNFSSGRSRLGQKIVPL